MNDYLQRWCDGLRELADFVASHEDLFEYAPDFTCNLFACDAADMADQARRFGTANKREGGKWYWLERSFGPHSIALNIAREQICERVQVGTQKVMKPVPNAPQIEVEEPVYEWSCPDSVLAMSKARDDDA
jgi:hypothetical protein